MEQFGGQLATRRRLLTSQRSVSLFVYMLPLKISNAPDTVIDSDATDRVVRFLLLS